MAIMLIQSTSTTSSTSLAFSSNNTAGNLLVCFYENVTSTVPSDSQGNTWAAAGSGSYNVFYAMNCKGGANTVSTASSASVVAVYEFSGVVTTSAADVHGFGSGTGTASCTTTQAGDLVFAWGDDFNSGSYPTITVGSGWTAGQTMHYTTGGPDITAQNGWIVQGAAGSISTSGWSTSNGNWSNGTCIASFFAAASLPSFVVGGEMLMGIGN